MEIMFRKIIPSDVQANFVKRSHRLSVL